MQNTSDNSPFKRPLFAWRALTSVLIAASFVFLVFSGIILFVSPPGRVANWTNWTLLTLRKQEWIGLHIWFSLLFLAVAVVHIVFNWRPMVNYFRDRMTRRIGFRWEWVAALAICLAVYGGTRAGVVPFSSLLAFNERVKESWDTPQERAPIPHAELLTLAELVQKAGLDMATATVRLQAEGIAGASPEIVVQQLADKNQRSARQVYEVLTKATGPGQPGEHAGAGRPGSGPGMKTLEQFCADEGIDLKETLARLEAKGIKAAADLTMREIAVNNGYTRPYELLEMIRSK